MALTVFIIQRVVVFQQQGLHGIGGSAVLASRDGHTIWTTGAQGIAAIRDGKVTLITQKACPASKSRHFLKTIGMFFGWASIETFFHIRMAGSVKQSVATVNQQVWSLGWPRMLAVSYG